MKPQKIEPSWGLAFGFLIAPFVCALNVTLLEAFTSGFWPRLWWLELLRGGFAALILTGPLGFMTSRLLEIWQGGDTSKARALGLGFGLFTGAFWAWWIVTWLETQTWGTLNWGLLALPFLWSILIPLFALFARAPKS